MKIRDRIWLWGQDVASHHHAGEHKSNIWNLPGENKMDSAEGADFFGIKNIFRVVSGGSPKPPFAPEMEKIPNAEQVVWSILGDMGTEFFRQKDDCDEVLKVAEQYPAVKGGVFDDFFYDGSRADGKLARLSVERVAEIREMLHSFKRPLELYLVIYEMILEKDCKPYLDQCDIITFWTWYAEHINDLEDNLKKVFDLSPDKKHFGGCYGYDYGNCRPMDMDLIKKQCDLYTKYLKSDILQGAIICSNCIADLGLPAIDYIRDWVAEIGDEEVELKN